MSTIKMHIFSSKSEIPIYENKLSNTIVGFLNKGEWMGVVDEDEQYFQVISAHHTGWVSRNDCVSGNPESIFIQLIDGRHYYINSEIN